MSLGKSRVLLIMPDYPEFKTYGPQSDIVFPPLGLEYIAAYIRDISEVRILDMRLKDIDLCIIENMLREYKPDYVGISYNYTFQINIVLEITRLCKDFEITTIVGGWHPTLAPSDTLSHESIDIIVRGEGEITFRTILLNKKLDGILGVSFKKEGQQIHNKDRDFLDLKTSRLPYRNYRYKSKSDYNFLGFPIDCIETSRGCPFDCSFCCIHEFYKKRYRSRTLESIIKELKTPIINNKASLIFFVDDNFVVKKEFIMSLCDAIIENKIHKYFMAQARVDMIVNHPELFKKMAEAGFIFLFLGIESFSDRTLKSLNKRTKFKQIKLALRILHDFGYIIQGNVIIGANLEDKIEDLQSTIDISKDMEIDLPTFSLLTPFPGTKLMDEVMDKGLLMDKDWSNFNWATPVIEFPYLSAEDLNHYYLKAYKEVLFSKARFGKIMQLLILKSPKYHLQRLLNVELIKGLYKFLGTKFRRSNKDKYYD